MNHLSLGRVWLLLSAALPAACVLVQPLDSATPGDETAAAGSTPAHAGAKGMDGSAIGSAGEGGAEEAAAGGAPAGGGGAGGTPGGGGGGTDKALFIGTWTITSGTGTLNCNGTVSSEPLSGSNTWSAGTSSDLVYDPSSVCPMKATINGRTATGERGFSCTTSGIDSSNGAPYTVVVKVNSSAFVVLSGDKTATAVLSGTQTETEGGTSVTCDLSKQANYTKN